LYLFCCLSRLCHEEAFCAPVYLIIFTIFLAGAMHDFPSGLPSAARRSVATATR
jgi:hypothetical protein